MFIIHLALGGCLKAPPIRYGITADTGGHIAYVLDAAVAQAAVTGVDRVSIVTRRFRDPQLPGAHDRASEPLSDRVTIDRIATADLRYLEKEALAADLPAFVEAFCRHLEALSALPDVIHAHFADAAHVAIAARRRFGIPFVFTPHALAIDKRAQGLGAGGLDTRIDAEREAIAAADAIIVSTHDEAERQVAAYGIAVTGRVHRMPPGVPSRPAVTRVPTLADRLDEWLDAPERPIILAIARPVAKKNLAGLLRAYAGCPALRDRANLVILAGQHGDHATPEEGAVHAELGRLAVSPVLRGKVALPVAHDMADVTGLYRRASAGGVFVNPALHEPFGLTLIEAAEAGVPVVATRNGGPAEIVGTIGHGLLVDPRDKPGIAAACLAVIGDAGLHARLRAAALAGVGHYDWHSYARASVGLYRTLRRTPGLLACDIDNTLTGCRAGAAAFAEWRQNTGLPFVVATGRSFDAARAILAEWNLPEPDAYLVDVGTRMMLRGPGGAWRECGDYARALDADWDLAAIRRTLSPLALTPQPADTATAHKLSFFGDAADASRIRTALADAGLLARVVFSHGRLIDILPPAGGKAAAIATYAARIGLTLADCAAAGDSGNDLDMLEACGIAIVVANADAELEGLAVRPGLYRTRRRHAAGVMEALDRLGLNRAAPVNAIPAPRRAA